MPTITKQKGASRAKPKRPATGILSQVQPLEAGLKERGLKVNLYGASGTGKTTLWATFPGRVLAVVCSGGTNPGELLSINTPEYRKKIDKLAINKSGDLTEVVNHMRKYPDDYATLVLDHATGLQDLILKEVLDIDEVPAQLGWGIASQQDWGQVALQMKERLRELLGLPQNVVIIAQERAFNTDQDESLLMPYVASALSPSVVGWLNPAVDYLCRTFKRKKVVKKKVKIGGKETIITEQTNEIEYCLQTGPDDVYMTKFRKPKTDKPLPPVIIDPTYEKLAKLIFN